MQGCLCRVASSVEIDDRLVTECVEMANVWNKELACEQQVQGGDGGGQILYQGPLEGLKKIKGSHTARYV